jgi:energy-coupling factor transporter ATP-binding protein EcfA2
MHIAKVKTNAKVGADVEIGPKTLIVGRNGSGKSTIINAVELALTSRVSDVAGRTDIAREADVMALAPPGESLVAQVTFDDGTQARYCVTGSTAKAKKADVARPAGLEHEEVLPIRALKDAVLGSPTTARKYLLSKVAGDVTRDTVAELMPTDEMKRTWASLAATFDASTATPDVLVAVLEKAGKLQRDSNSEAKSAREASKLVSGGRASPPSKDELSAATKARDAARDAWMRASEEQSAGARAIMVADELEKLVPKAEAAMAEAVQLGAELANTPQPVAPHPVFPHVCAVLKESIAQGECLVCGSGKPDQSALTFLEQELAGYQKATAEYTALTARQRVAQNTADSLIARLEALEADLARMGGMAANRPDVAGMKATLDAAEAKLTDLRVVADAWAAARKNEAVAVEAEAAADRWKAFKGACEDAVGVVLNQALSRFKARVQENLPEGDTFELRLQDGDREVVSFGLLRGGALHTALSGAEWARVVAAMAAACVPAGRFAVLVPEERAFDPETLTEVLEAFSSSPHQVILASPVKPKKVPKGWKIVTRGDA